MTLRDKGTHGLCQVYKMEIIFFWQTTSKFSRCPLTPVSHYENRINKCNIFSFFSTRSFWSILTLGYWWEVLYEEL